MLIISEIAAKTGMLMLLGEINSKFLADRTIGRAFGTMCRLSVCLSVWVAAVFLLLVSPVQPLDGCFLPYVLWQNGTS